MKSRDIAVSAEAIEADPTKWAIQSSELLGVTVLLKGSQSVVADGERVITLPTATPWLATAGSGDVLAGIIGALVSTNYIEILNQPNRLADIAAAGAFIHNRAALAASAGGPISAGRIIDFIPQVIQKLIA